MPDFSSREPELPAWALIACGLMLSAVLIYTGFEHSRALGLVSLAFCGFALLAAIGIALLQARHGGAQRGKGRHVD